MAVFFLRRALCLLDLLNLSCGGQRLRLELKRELDLIVRSDWLRNPSERLFMVLSVGFRVFSLRPLNYKGAYLLHAVELLIAGLHADVHKTVHEVLRVQILPFLDRL